MFAVRTPDVSMETRQCRRAKKLWNNIMHIMNSCACSKCMSSFLSTLAWVANLLAIVCLICKIIGASSRWECASVFGSSPGSVKGVREPFAGAVKAGHAKLQPISRAGVRKDVALAAPWLYKMRATISPRPNRWPRQSPRRCWLTVKWPRHLPDQRAPASVCVYLV